MNEMGLECLLAFQKSEQLSAVLLSNSNSLTWLTGYAPPIETGPSPFEGGPALAWCCEGQVTLLMSDMEAGSARTHAEDVLDYVAYTIEAPLSGYANQAAILARLLAKFIGLHGRVGVEMDTLPASLFSVVQKTLPGITLVPLDGRMDLLRAVKTAEELEHIQSALELCDLAQAEIQRQIQPGKTEIEVWGAVKARVEDHAGTRVPVLVDLVAGKRTAEIGGLPGGYVIQEGDPVMLDIVPRSAGYWGDNCGIHFAGEASAELKKVYTIVLDTLRTGIQAVKPGLKACDLDNLLRSFIRNRGYPVYPHHSGHGIGTSYHEEPRIVPYNPLQLQPGMVIALEPGIYLPDIGGVRLENVVLVTESGYQLLTHHLDNLL
jgi:Xaa-Pro aminopeptidase